MKTFYITALLSFLSIGLFAQKFQNDSVYVGFKVAYIYNEGDESEEDERKDYGKGYKFFNGSVRVNESLNFNVISGKCESITLHAIYKNGVWANVYNGKLTDLSFEKYFKKNFNNDKIKAYYITVNGPHDRYSKVACEINIEKFRWVKPQADFYKVELEKLDYKLTSSNSYTGVGMDGVSTLRIDIQLPGRKKVFFSSPRIGELNYKGKKKRGFKDRGSDEEKHGISNIVELNDGKAIIYYIPPKNMSLKEQNKFNNDYYKKNVRFYDGRRSSSLIDTIYYQFVDFDGSVKIKALSIEIVRPPVLFVHGFLGNVRTWKYMEEKLRKEYGFKTYRHSYHSGIEGSIEDQSDALEYNIDNALNEIGKNIKIQKVDLICHSMGGLIARGYVQDKENYNNDVRKLITVGTPHHGVNTPGYYLGKIGSYAFNQHHKAIEQLHSSSKYLDELNKGYRGATHLVKGIEYGNIYVYPTDMVVRANSAKLNRVKSYVLPGGFRHSTDIPGGPAITTSERVEKVLVKWLTNEKIPRVQNSYIHVELSRSSNGEIFRNRKRIDGDIAKRKIRKSQLPMLIKLNSVVKTLDGHAVIHFKFEKKIWGSVFLSDSSEIYIGNCSPEMMNIRLIKGKALFKSSYRQGNEKGHFFVDIGGGNPIISKSKWYKFNPLGSVRGLNTEFAIDFNGKDAVVKSLEGKMEVTRAGNLDFKAIVIEENGALDIDKNSTKKITYSKEKWWNDLDEIIKKEDNKTDLTEIDNKTDDDISVDDIEENQETTIEDEDALIGLIVIIVFTAIIAAIIILIIKKKKRRIS